MRRRPAGHGLPWSGCWRCENKDDGRAASSLLHQIRQLVRQDMWKMRQEMPENGRISGASQVYLLLSEKEMPAFSTAQGKMIMRMTPEAFHTWSQRLRLSSETEALIASIRSSPPVRRVSGRAKNITGPRDTQRVFIRRVSPE